MLTSGGERLTIRTECQAFDPTLLSLQRISRELAARYVPEANVAAATSERQRLAIWTKCQASHTILWSICVITQTMSIPSERVSQRLATRYVPQHDGGTITPRRQSLTIWTERQLTNSVGMLREQVS